MKIMIIFERFVVLMWKYLNFQFPPNFFWWLEVFTKILSSECEVSFYWGPARVNFDSSLFWNCIFTTEKNCRAGISNFNNNEFHEPLEIKCYFQWPSSSDSPLHLDQCSRITFSLFSSIIMSFGHCVLQRW